MSKVIKLTQGKFALVDDADYEWLNQWKWRCQRSHKCNSDLKYAVRQIRLSPPSNGHSGKRIFFAMHREIMKLDKNNRLTVDHIDGNGLNNQKSNMRICSLADNLRNQRKNKNSKMSQYKGVAKNKSNKRGIYKTGKMPRLWQARITVNSNIIYLGSFTTETKAAEAYDVAALKYFGKFAKLNFPPLSFPYNIPARLEAEGVPVNGCSLINYERR